MMIDVNDSELRRTFLCDDLPRSLDALTADTLPVWGRMTPQQMVEHLVWTFMASRGAVEVSCVTPVHLHERMRRFLYDDRPMPRQFQSPVLAGGIPPLLYRNLAEAREMLRAEVERFFYYSREHPDALHTHPVLGDLSMEEWERNHYKHCYHHLLQFGLVPPEN